MGTSGILPLLTVFFLYGFASVAVAQGGAASIDGVYDQQRDQCANLNSETRLVIKGDVFTFYESECTFGRRGGRSDASEGTLICIGEGQRFNRDIELGGEADGSLQIVENDTALNYARCPD